MKLIPDYEHCIVNFMSSIMKQFMIPSSFRTIREVEKLLKYDYQNIIVLNLRGFSSHVLDSMLFPDNFFSQHKVRDIDSVISMGQTTSQNCLEFGKPPYLLRPSFFQQLDSLKVSDVASSDKDIISMINDSDSFSAYGIFPTGVGAYSTREEMYQRIFNFSQHGNGKKRYIYAVCDDLLELICKVGLQDRKCQDLVQIIESEIEQLSERLTDSLLFVISDCGYRAVSPTGICFSDYSKILEYIEKTFPINQRCAFFRIREGMTESFVSFFHSTFAKDFRLISVDEYPNKNLFGVELRNIDSLCQRDFIAIGIGDKYFSTSSSDPCLVATGGVHLDEIRVPIVAIARKKVQDREIVRRISETDFLQFHSLMTEYHTTRVNVKKDVFRRAEAITKTEFLSLCQRFNSDTVFVYMIDEKLVGFIQIELVTSSGSRLFCGQTVLEIVNLYVAKEYRRQRIGTKLCDEVFRYAKKLHVKKVQFVVWDFDSEMQKFVHSIHMKISNCRYEIEI